MEIWPAIDIRNGACVRLRQGDFAQQTMYGTSISDMVQHWIDEGAARLHLVDLDAALGPAASNLPAIEAVLAETSLPVQIGGGIRSTEVIERLLAAGAAQLVCGTRACDDPTWFALMSERYPGKLALGLDARNGRVAVDGWTRTTVTPAAEFVQFVKSLPLAAIIYTDIARDGMMSGPNLDGLREIVAASAHPIIASGGIASLGDIAAVTKTGAAGCIIGRALYEHRIELRVAMAQANDGFGRASRLADNG